MTNPDRVLSAAERIGSGCDHAILDRCQRWFNLAREGIANRIPQARRPAGPQARIVDLGPDGPA